ncbi:DUF4190 domain-containing protein [Frigoribacterium sp. CFBP 13729]|uniref:DUF4190 domain-containing protein n=1 Tax=unclassified Frigoribacterium TaxID=2627005 RepID=UPI001784F255|nr:MULTISPECIES: DUF4190 domain-containing protein [unclassified Frigoribacterium]MBD8583235.1 DUF4190 domain-containing protein [Frigoribacterium sp. CFBP 8766]MBD8610985.1 DUF4190 domain-containing protein [Frigoribacterium sp. CFBP 13729]
MTYDQNTPATTTSGASAKFNTLAIVGFVLAFVVNIAGVVVSFIALSQIKKTGERGRGLAIAGIIIGLLSIVFGIIYITVLLPMIMEQVGTVPTY